MFHAIGGKLGRNTAKMTSGATEYELKYQYLEEKETYARLLSLKCITASASTSPAVIKAVAGATAKAIKVASTILGGVPDPILGLKTTN
ncbi:MAG: hypothetical protein HRT35_09445 [Algicola sp.]|nr:hypothetical protein [Algicola sp.]